MRAVESLLVFVVAHVLELFMALRSVKVLNKYSLNRFLSLRSVYLGMSKFSTECLVGYLYLDTLRFGEQWNERRQFV